MQYDDAVGCRGEEMKIVSLLNGTFIKTAMKRGIDIHDTYMLKNHSK